MANWGNTGSASGDYVGASVPRGIYITINETGQIDSVWARVFELNASNENDLKAIVYDSSNNYLGESDVVETVTTSTAWVEMPFSSPVSVTSGNEYRIYIWSTFVTDEIAIHRDSGNGYHDDNFPTWPTESDPVNPSLDGTSHYYGIYAEVSAGGTSSESIPVGTLELIGIAPGTATVSTLSAEGIPVGTLTLTGFAPHPETNDYSVQFLTLTGFAPGYSIQGVVSASIPVATFELIGFAPETLAVGLALEPIPAGTLTLTGFAPESQVTGGADEGIPSGTLEMVGFAPATQQIGTQSEGIPNNVIYLSSYAPGYNIPGQVGPRRKTGGKRGRPRPRRIVIIGGQRHVVHSYTEERYLLEQYLKRLQIEESQEEAPEVRKRPVKLVSRNISLTETRIAKLDQRLEWHRKKLRQEDDLLLSLFG